MEANVRFSGDKRLERGNGRSVSARVLEASLVARGSDCSNPKESPAISSEDDEVSREQQARLEAWGRKNDFWVEDISHRLELQYGEPVAKGGEAIVYYDSLNRLIVKEICLNYFGEPLLLLDRIHIHNSLFPDTALQLEMLGRDAEGRFWAVCSQRFIIGSSPDQVEIDSYVEKTLGMSRTKHIYANEFADEHIVLSDLHDENVIKGSNGKLYFIDIDGRLNTPDLGLGGTYH